MKILHCINSLNIGGAEKTLVRIINKSKFQHSIITILNSHKLKEVLKEEVLILSLFPIDFKKILDIYLFVKDFNPDLFQGWMYHGDFLATILGIIFRKPIFWNIRHGKMSLRFSSKKTIILRTFLSILSYLYPLKIISCSFCGVRVHKNIYYSKNKFKVIHNGINLSNFQTKKIVNLANQKFIRIGSVGRDSPQKNRIYFLKILSELCKHRKIKSFIFGKGVLKSKEIRRSFFPKEINLSLNESQIDIKDIFSNIYVLIVTSLYGEGCPNVLIEAMQSGVLVFSTDVGDAKYIVGDERFIIPDNDPLLAASKILKVFHSKNIEQYILNFKKRSDKLFNEKTMIKEYEKIWSSTF